MSKQYTIRVTSKQIGKSRLLSLKTGREGPRHDPYSYSEFHVSQGLKSCITLHLGLSVSLIVNGADKTCKRAGKHKDWENATIARFEKLVGFSIHDMEKWIMTAQYRCKRCGNKGTHPEEGYPGEILNVCNKCNRVVSTDFDESCIL